MCVCSPSMLNSLQTRNGVLCGKPLNIYLDVSPSSCVCVCVCQLWIQAFPRFFHNCYHLSLSSLCCRAAFPEVESQQPAFFLLSHSFFYLFIYFCSCPSWLLKAQFCPIIPQRFVASAITGDVNKTAYDRYDRHKYCNHSIFFPFPKKKNATRLSGNAFKAPSFWGIDGQAWNRMWH